MHYILPLPSTFASVLAVAGESFVCYERQECGIRTVDHGMGNVEWEI